MTKIYDVFGLHLAELGPRLLATKAFKVGTPDVDFFLSELPVNHRHKLLNHAVGVEVEVEKCYPFVVPGWLQEEDGSLRNNGKEYKTRYGTRIYNVPDLLTTLFDSINKKGIPEFTERCSIHVHLDMRTLTLTHLTNLCVLYILTEESLFRYASIDRRDNVFCVPFLNSTHLNAPTNISEVTATASKYTAFNMACLKEFGTVEFRHLAGTFDIMRIFRWILLVGSLVYKAQTITNVDLMRMLEKLKIASNYDQFLQELFHEGKQWLTYDPFAIDSAVTDAKFFLSKMGD